MRIELTNLGIYRLHRDREFIGRKSMVLQVGGASVLRRVMCVVCMKRKWFQDSEGFSPAFDTKTPHI